jgi:hypothetical protein
LAWYLDRYRIGKHRQWIGAPVPVLVQYKEEKRDYFQRPEVRPEPPRPVLHIDTKVGQSTDFKMHELGVWVTRLDTRLLGPGMHELFFDIDERTTMQASEHPLLLLNANDYRKELMEEAGEKFMPSLGIWDSGQLNDFIQATIRRKLREEGLDDPIYISPYRKETLGTFPKPIASAPINWVLEALIIEFVYLSTFSPAARQKGPVWRIHMEENFLELSFETAFSSFLDEEIAASVNNRELGLLYLLNSKEDQRFQAKTDVSSAAAHLSVKFDMYKAPVL